MIRRRGPCSNGHLEAARLLIEKGADLEAKDSVSIISSIPASVTSYVTVSSCQLANSTLISVFVMVITTDTSSASIDVI